MKLARRGFIAFAAICLGLFSAGGAVAQDTSTMEQVKQTGNLRIGVTSAEPWFFKDPATDQWTGVGISMGEKLATALGVEMVPVETTWANAVAALQANQIDIMFVLDPTEERRKAIGFPDAPLFYYALGALVPEDSNITAWSDLDKAGMRIGVTLGTSVDKKITETMKNAEISRFSNNDEAVAAFAANRVDVVVQFHPALVVQYSRLKLGKVILPEPVEPVATSAGVRKEESDGFRNWVSGQFVELYEAGVPDEIFAEYLQTKGIDASTIPGLVKEDWD